MSEKKCSRLDIEQYFTNELDQEKRKEIEIHVEDCKECKTHLTKLGFEKDLFLKYQPYSVFEKKLNKKQEREHAPIGFQFRPAMVFTAMIITVTSFFVYKQLATVSPENSSENRIKGSPSISVIVKRGENIMRQEDIHGFLPGDNIQIVARPSSFHYITLFSIDEHGTETVYDLSPENAHVSSVVQHSDEQYLPFAIELDENLGRELYCVLFSQEPYLESTIKDLLHNRKKLFNFEEHSLKKSLQDLFDEGIYLENILIQK